MLLRTSAAAFVSLSLIVNAASAHHSDAAFDSHQLITLRGVVTRFSWENPHIRVYLDVTDAGGARATWAVEGNPPGRIGGRGLKNALKVGEAVTISAYRAKDPSARSARGYGLVLADGRRFMIGSSGTDAPPAIK